MDNQPVTATALGKFFHIKGTEVERYYKHHLSDYDVWKQKEHASDWILLSENIGTDCSIDETQLCDEVYTILSNKAGKGKKGSVIAIVKGTRIETVSNIINQIPYDKRALVKEITMDFSDSMYGIAKHCFPNASIVIDCFHVVQRLCESLDSIRLKFKRLAVAELKKESCEFKKQEALRAKRRSYYRKTHKRNPNEKRGRKRIRRKVFKPSTLENGDTKIELLTRSRYILPKSGNKWGVHQRERAKLLFDLYPDLKEGYSLVCKVRNIFKQHISIEEARTKLQDWYKEVNACTLREIKAARDCIKFKEEEVLNYFNNRSTNASAESLNSKIKGFRAQLHGVSDIPFFMYRISKVFG